MGVWYCTRESVKGALDYKLTAYNNTQVDAAIEAASRAIEGQLHRKFYPTTATRYFDWPNQQYARSWRLWLDEDELISVTTLTSGGTTIASTDYFLEPVNLGPPYHSIEIDLDSSASFSSGNTHQRSVAVTGVFGYSADTTPAGTLNEALDSSETEVDISDASLIGVGDIIKVENEYMLVTGASLMDTTYNLTGGVTTAQANDVAATVTDGTQFHVGEVIQVTALTPEKMLIVDIAGNTLTVKRGWDGSGLQTHGTDDIYAYRRLTVQRGALGTTAAAHNTATAITKHVVPGLIASLCKAEAINIIQQDQSGWGRVVGSGENEREMAGRGLASLWEQAKDAYSRLRVAAV